MKRIHGVVVSWFGDKNKNFGFIQPDGQVAPQVFCHLNDCAPGVNGLADGMRVSYIEAMGMRGLKAVDCRPAETLMQELPVADRTEKLS
jgi:cold shock CspA family protein